MQRVKRRTFSGVVCEQEVYNVPDRIKSLEKAEPRPRFKNEEERELHRIGISRRKHARLINENYGPTSLYSTLTLDNESEVHTFDEARRIRDLYVRRLKYHAPDAKINIYMGRGKTTFRIHFHMISEGVSEKLIRDLWGLGDVLRIEHLREHNYYNGVDYDRVRRRDRVLFRHSDPARTERHGRDSDHRGGKVNELGRLYRKGALYRPGL